jgi:hypothetical protein
MSKVRTALSLSRTDLRLLLEAACTLLKAWTMLRLRPFKSVVATLDRVLSNPRAVPADIAKVRWAVECVARNLPLALTCLPQAFAASWMLARRGGKPQVHYGVAKTDSGGFEAHAWVEQDGKPVVGHRVAGRFTLLATFPQESPL